MDLRVERLSGIRVLRRPEEGLQALVERAPQAEAWAERTTEKLRPTLTLFYDNRRRLATAGVGVLTLWLFLHVVLGANGMVVYRQKRAEYLELQKEIDDLQKENDRYSGQVKALQSDPKTIEREAREQLHYTRPGEVVYVVPAPSPPPPPASNTAKK
ncbi:MAG TPA: septum formation initiator family protein [Terriglobales bacterium]|jgi:cell division protein FtsB|nr:septum formation initiator family protein [Terriglobales bacterium]